MDIAKPRVELRRHQRFYVLNTRGSVRHSAGFLCQIRTRILDSFKTLLFVGVHVSLQYLVAYSIQQSCIKRSSLSLKYMLLSLLVDVDESAEELGAGVTVHDPALLVERLQRKFFLGYFLLHPNDQFAMDAHQRLLKRWL